MGWHSYHVSWRFINLFKTYVGDRQTDGNTDIVITKVYLSLSFHNESRLKTLIWTVHTINCLSFGRIYCTVLILHTSFRRGSVAMNGILISQSRYDIKVITVCQYMILTHPMCPVLWWLWASLHLRWGRSGMIAGWVTLAQLLLSFQQWMFYSNFLLSSGSNRNIDVNGTIF